MKQRKIRVLNVLGSFMIGGAEMLALSVLKRHDRTQFEFGVCALNDRPGPTLAEQFGELGIKCYHLGRPLRKSWTSAPIQCARSLMQLAAGLRDIGRRFRPDIVHAHLAWPGILSRVVFGGRNVRLVSTLHSPAVEDGLARRLAERITTHLVRPYVVACSETVRQAHVGNGMVPRQLCITIPNGVDTDRFDPTRVDPPADDSWIRHPDALRVLQVGRLGPEKGYDITIQSVRLLTERGVNVTVYAAGRGRLQDALADQARQAGVEDRMVFLGARSDVKALLKAADLFIMPSRWEGVSIALLEAMSMELPVIASAAGGTKEVIEDGVSGVLIPVATPALLADRIMMLAKQAPEQRRLMGRRARQRVLEHYSLRRQVARLEDFYRELAGRTSSMT